MAIHSYGPIKVDRRDATLALMRAAVAIDAALRARLCAPSCAATEAVWTFPILDGHNYIGP